MTGPSYPVYVSPSLLRQLKKLADKGDAVAAAELASGRWAPVKMIPVSGERVLRGRAVW